MRTLFFILVLSLFSACSTPITFNENSDVTIYRDKWGVPHIHGKTDADVAYGLAWVQCEDDFITMQEQMLAIRGRLGEVRGRAGLIADFGIAFMDLGKVVDQKYDSDVSDKFKSILQSFSDGVNTFAAKNPNEVLLKKLFPVTPKDLIKGYILGAAEISGVRSQLEKLVDGSIADNKDPIFPKGSNAIAIGDKKTSGEGTFLAINSHQPLEGWYSWYEAHLISDEGTNILGGTFPGGVNIFHGINEHLGWAHTVNHADFVDVYKLKMNPSDESEYEWDSEWLPLKSKKIWAKMKWGPLKIPIRQKIYRSKIGPTFKTPNGFYALKYAANETVQAAEQWYRMNKSRSLDEFKQALQMRGIVSTNIVYADKEHNIFYLSNATLPKRSREYDWQQILPGNQSQLLWSIEDAIGLEQLPQIENPKSGFVFNSNNSPFIASDLNDNVPEVNIDATLGFQASPINNNRSTRFLELINTFDSLTYDDFKAIKFDIQYPKSLTATKMLNLELMMNLDHNQHPQIKNEIKMLESWDRKTNLQSTNAALFIVSIRKLVEGLTKKKQYFRGAHITESDAVAAIVAAKSHLISHFGKVNVPLKDFQVHSRGDVHFPIEGGPDVLAAIHGKEMEDGRYRAFAGESYIALVQFVDGKPKIETIHSYGSSAESSSPHYTDQMEMFIEKELKPMSLDLQIVKKEAVIKYHPLRQ